MKINVTLSIDVDPKEWLAVGYGGGESASEIREDVKQYVLNHVQGAAGIEESDAVVTLK